jgi:FixJ family two-component response regulator
MKSILILDDDRDLCIVLKDLFQIFGVTKCVFLNSVEELKKIQNVLEFEIALLDVNLGDNLPSGIDAYDWLIQKNYHGQIVFFTGHARSHPMVEKALSFPNVTLLEKPAAISSFEKLLT